MRTRRPALALAGLAMLGAACGGDGGGGSADAFCEDAAGLEERFSALEEVGPGELPAFHELESALGELTPPEEIADDFEVLRDAVGQLSEVLSDVDLQNPDPSVMQELQGLQDELGNLEEASANVEAYLSDECGIDDGDTSETASDPASETASE